MRHLIAIVALLAAVVAGKAQGVKTQKWSELTHIALRSDETRGWDIVDTNGRVVGSNLYGANSKVGLIRGGAYWVRDDEGYHLYDVSDPTTPASQTVYVKASEFAHGRAIVYEVGKTLAIIDETGRTVATLPDSIVYARDFDSQGRSRFSKLDGRFGFFDTKGRLTVAAQYSKAGSYGTMLVPAEVAQVMTTDDVEQNVLRIIDTSGRTLHTIDLTTYTPMAEEYADGLLPMRDNTTGDAVCIDQRGREAFRLKDVEDIEKFLDGYASLTAADGHRRIIDRKGNTVHETSDALWNLGQGMFAHFNADYEFGLRSIKQGEVFPTPLAFIYPYRIGANYLCHLDSTTLVTQPTNVIGTRYAEASYEDMSGGVIDLSRLFPYTVAKYFASDEPRATAFGSYTMKEFFDTNYNIDTDVYEEPNAFAELIEPDQYSGIVYGHQGYFFGPDYKLEATDLVFVPNPQCVDLAIYYATLLETFKSNGFEETGPCDATSATLSNGRFSVRLLQKIYSGEYPSVIIRMAADPSKLGYYDALPNI